VVAAVSAATVGAVLASRRPSHPVGWLLLGLGLSMQVHGVAQEYVADGLVGRPGALPAAGYLIGVLPRHCGPLAVVRQLCPAVDSDRAAALAPLVVVGQADRGRSGGVPAGIGG
jgi:hypothetical protein